MLISWFIPFLYAKSTNTLKWNSRIEEWCQTTMFDLVMKDLGSIYKILGSIPTH
jgi:hypothetical protein